MQTAATEKTSRISPLRGFLPFFWLALACLGGIWLAEVFALPGWVWLLGVFLSLSTLLLTIFLPKHLAFRHKLRRWTRAEQRLPGAMLAVVFFFGGFRYAAAQAQVTPAHVAFYNDRGVVQVVGTLAAPPDVRDGATNLVIEVEALTPLDGSNLAPLTVSGRVLVQAPSSAIFHYGDWLRVTGQLETPFESADFSYKDYLSRKGIYSLMRYVKVDRLGTGRGRPMRAFLYRMSDRGFAALHQLFPSPESDLLAGILLGRDQGLSPALQEDFRRTGTTHIIAISGFNVAILAGLFSGVFTRLLGRKWGAIIAVVAIVGFTILVGGEAAVVRAAIMGALGVLGGMFGKRQNGLNSLGLAALGMMLVNPHLPWDIGFQLSLAATLGLVLYAQPLEERFVKLASRKLSEAQAQRWVGPVSELFLFTLAAQVMTLPLIAYHFGGLSWVAFVANPLVLPPQALVLILGGLAMLPGMVLPGLGAFMAVLALPFVRYTIRMVEWLGNLPGGDLVLPEFHVLWLVLFYGFLFALTVLPEQERDKLGKAVFSYQVGGLILTGFVFLTWNRVLTQPDGRLHLTLLDSEGTVLVLSPDGRSVLIGGGSSPSLLNQYLGELLPGGYRAMDVLIVGSAAHEDLNGLAGALRKVPFRMALWGIDPEVNHTSRSTYASLVEKDIPITTLSAGQSLDLGGGIRLEVLWTGERGAVLWLEWAQFSAILPTGKVDEYRMAVPGAPDMVLLPDGVEVESQWVSQVVDWQPAAILFPLAQNDLPLQGDHALLLEMQEFPLLTTLEHGWLRVSTDGAQVWVWAEHR